MRVLHRYVGGSFLLNLVATLVVFSLVMAIGSIIRAIDLIARGASAALLGKFLALNIPYLLQYTIPMSAMTATLLLFTRLSLDGEITAMRACGLNLWSVASPVIVAAFWVAVATVGVAQWWAPVARYGQRMLVAELTGDDPIQWIEPGRWTRDFPGLIVFVGGKESNRLQRVIIYRIVNDRVLTTIRAQEGRVRPHPTDPSKLLLDLYHVRVEDPDRKDPTNPLKARRMVAEYQLQEVDLGRLRQKAVPRKRTSDLTLPELELAIADARRDLDSGLEMADTAAEECMKLLVERNGRFAMGFAVVSMSLIAIPLGMRSRRRESSVGVLLSLAVIFVFYFFLMLARSAADRPTWHPDLWVWVPVVGAQIIGIIWIERSG